MSYGGLTEAQIKDIIQAAVGFDKVKIPQPAASEYATPSGTSIASSEGHTQIADIVAIADSVTLNGGVGQPSRLGEKVVTASSALFGKTIKRIAVELRKTGAPTAAPVVARIWDSANTEKAVATVIANAQDLPVAYTQYIITFNNAVSLQAGDRIFIEYTGGSSGNGVQIRTNFNNGSTFDGTNTVYTTFVNGAWADANTDEVDMTIFELSPVANAKDGNTATSWKSDPEANPYYVIDTGALRLISGIRIYWNVNGRPTNFDIDYSEDNITYTPTSRQNVPQGTAGQYNEYAFNTVYARYIRVQANETIAMEIAEIQYFERTSDRILARHGHGSAS